MECQDCNKKVADTLIYCIEKSMFFVVCRDCIKDTDKICPDELLKLNNL